MNGPFALLMLALANPPPVTSLPPEVDDAVFREALRERGLDDWLEQYEVDTPPADEPEQLLREREKLLAGAIAAKDLAGRADALARAAELLQRAIARYPQDPRCLRWRLERVRDLLERRDPEVFDGLLLYELPGQRSDRARRLAADALSEITPLREGVSAAWKSLESLDENALATLRTSSSVRQLQEIDLQSRLLLAWARLYGVLTEPNLERRQEESGKLLDDVLMAGWTELPRGLEARRCSALVLAAISARVAARFDQANGFAREIVGMLKSSTIPAPAVRQASLIAVLEQVRILRDNGKCNEASTAVRQATEWIERTRPDDGPARIAAALLECSILACQQNPTTLPATTVTLHAGHLQPLSALAAKSSAMRDEIYRALAGCPVDPAQLSDERVLQLWAGSVIHEAQRMDPPASDVRQRLSEVARLLQERLDRAPGAQESSSLPELAFLCGRAWFLLEVYPRAVSAMSQVPARWPRHERAEPAARAGVSIASEWLTRTAAPDRVAAREAFVRSVQLWRDRSPALPEVRQLQFFLAAELDQGARFDDAAREYARVDTSDANHARAAVARARCLRTLIPAATTQPASSRPASQTPEIQNALAASSTALTVALKARPEDPCLAAEAGVGMARLANDVRVARPADAVAALDQAAAALRACLAWRKTSLRERLEALRQLERWDDLVQTFVEYRQQDPSASGSAGPILLESIRQAVVRALDSNDESTLRSAAEQGAQLAQLLAVPGGQTQPSEQASTTTLELTRAWLLVHAGRPEQALPIYDRCRERVKAPADAAVGLRCELGRAECLLAQNRAAAAVGLYTDLLSRLPEHSVEWWEAYVGTLRCQEQLKADRGELLKSIQQQRRVAPDLGGPRWRRAIDHLERVLTS